MFNASLFTTTTLYGKSLQSAYDRVYLDYIELMPVVASVNAMSQEIGKNIEFSLFIENLATHDEAGKDKPKNVLVKVQHMVSENNCSKVYSANFVFL